MRNFARQSSAERVPLQPDPLQPGLGRPDGGPRETQLGVWPLPDRLATVRRARELLREALTALGFDAETTADGVLMVSELAGNAVRHACQPYELRLHRGERTLTCEVVDASPMLPPIHGSGAPSLTLAYVDAIDDPGVLEKGRGLQIVRRLSGGRCGTRPVLLHASGRPVRGKSVWFSLDLP